MRWFREATKFNQKYVLKSHLSRKTYATSAPYVHRSSQCASGRTYATEESSYRLVNNNYGKDESVDLEIISRASIKPASPTPHHLRTFGLSVIDQFIPGYYTPMILFLPNADKICASDVATIRTKRLKESLSELLTQYYPFAGEIRDSFHIECNDKGVYFVEARVNQTLEEFLSQPDDRKVRGLNPKHPTPSTSSSFGNHILSVQAWAAVARGLSPAPPSFVASKIFPNDPDLQYVLPSKLVTTKLPTTKRFVFDSVALASLKSRHFASTNKHDPSLPSRPPTRTEVTTALIWKAVAKAASTVRSFSPQSPHALMALVNMRTRASPPLPNESIGNLIDAAIVICFPYKEPSMRTLIGEIRESIAGVSSEYIESLKGENGHKAYTEKLKVLNELSNGTDERDWLMTTGLLNSGIYDIDFGWGKPIWYYHMNPGLSCGVVSFHEMRKGGGVEAIVSLTSQEMEIFESDPEVLSHATLNPSPLQCLD